jgi:short-chain fatty acids transporter
MTRFIRFFVGIFRRWMPDPYTLVLLLTLLVFGASYLGGEEPSSELSGLLTSWYKGFFSILPFTIQMALILIAGHALASAPLIQRLLQGLASRVQTDFGAVITIFLGSALASLLNWGFGLVVGGFLAKEIGKRSKVDYAFLVACAYSGFVLWHSGLSGSIPLVLASPGHELHFGLVPSEGLPITETTFSWLNIAVVFLCLIAIPFFLWLARPKIASSGSQYFQNQEDTHLPEKFIPETPSEKLDRSLLLTLVALLLPLGYVITQSLAGGLQVDLSFVIFIFLFLGIALHQRPLAYAKAFQGGGNVISPILLQYPFYGGIMGLVVDSGLAKIISQNMIELASAKTFPFLMFLSAGFLNVLVPSGGGQWAVQGPVVSEAAQQLALSPRAAALAVAWGDQWTNMIQPMWALPVLALAGKEAKDIMGYCVLTLLVTGVIFGGATFLF